MSKTKIQFNQKILLGLVVVLVAIYAINIFSTYSILSSFKVAEEKPAKLFLTLITNDCEDCFDMKNFINALKQQNVKIVKEKTLSASTQESKVLIDRHNIDALPALVITGEVDSPTISPIWYNLSVQVDNGAVVIQGIPPYYNLSTEKVEGLIQVILLTDNSCSECYDVEKHLQILPRFGVFVKDSSSYDISSNKGKELLQKYSINKVPTILLSPDASVYAGLVQIWTEVGTQENDGWYVFRNTEVMGTYKDLKSGEIVQLGG